jgi:hypothetical protein
MMYKVVYFTCKIIAFLFCWSLQSLYTMIPIAYRGDLVTSTNTVYFKKSVWKQWRQRWKESRILLIFKLCCYYLFLNVDGVSSFVGSCDDVHNVPWWGGGGAGSFGKNWFVFGVKCVYLQSSMQHWLSEVSCWRRFSSCVDSILLYKYSLDIQRV